MPTTCQQIIQRAAAFSTANAPLAQDTAEMLSRIRGEQRALYADLARADPDYLAAEMTLPVEAGAVALPPEVGAVLDVHTDAAPPVRVTRVDRLDPGAALPPRYTVRGRSLRAVALGELGAAVTVVYARAPRDIDPAAGPQQLVDVPDEWADVLVVPLARYLAAKDLGRPEGEAAQLDALAAARRAAFLAWAAEQGGTVVRASAPKRAAAGAAQDGARGGT